MTCRSRYGTQVVVSSWIAVFCLFGIRASFALLKDPLAQAMNWSQAKVTFGYSFMMIVYALTAFLCGIIVDRKGSRPVYAIAAIASLAGLMATGLMRSFAVYILSFSIMTGIATGMLWVTSTISVRKWYTGKQYASKWGWAFAGAPVSQFVLTFIVRHILMEDPATTWRLAFIALSLISGFMLLTAFFLAKREPEYYGFEAFGSVRENTYRDISWSLKQAFSRYAVWGAVATFLLSMMAEFLIWTQVVSYWVIDVGWTMADSAHVYAMIGLAGMVSMPLMGYFADYLVKLVKNEPQGRKIMLIIGPALGMLACILLLYSHQSKFFAYTASVFFAVYWAIVPGGAVGYIGSLYGRKTLGKIWGLCTLVVMGTGPFLGSLTGGYLKDLTGHFNHALYFAGGSFLLSAILAFSLPVKLKYPGNGQ